MHCSIASFLQTIEQLHLQYGSARPLRSSAGRPRAMSTCGFVTMFDKLADGVHSAQTTATSEAWEVTPVWLEFDCWTRSARLSVLRCQHVAVMLVTPGLPASCPMQLCRRLCLRRRRQRRLG